MDIRNEIKAYIVREGVTMSEVVDRLAYEYDWSSSVPNLSGKLRRGSLRYQEAITTKDTYHETKSKFAWIGEIEDERLLSALENLSDSDLELITLYAYEGYDTVEISKAFGTTKQNISKKIQRITNFIKNFQIGVV